MSEMVERVGAELRRVCLAEFGSTWSNDVAWRLSRTAIAAMREPTNEMTNAGDKEHRGIDDPDDTPRVWRAMIDAALEGDKMKDDDETPLQSFIRHLIQAAASQRATDNFDLRSEDPASVARYNQLCQEESDDCRALVDCVTEHRSALLEEFSRARLIGK